MYINGAIVVSTKHAARQGKILECDPVAGSMPHGYGLISHNMHGIDMVLYQYIHNDSGDILRYKTGL